METRPVDLPADADACWRLKRAFERELGTATGDEDKRAAYEDKLTDAYRERYLAWVDRCTDDDRRCVTLAIANGSPVGYVFVLPARLAMIWDAAVLNELYVEPGSRGGPAADALLEAALALAGEQDLPLERLVLDVDPDNERARAFYERYGFESWGEMLARPL